MSDSIGLVCAVLASMAAGVLLAYGVCLAMFGIFQVHARQTTERVETDVVGAAQVVEG